MILHDNFETGINPAWQVTEQGSGRVFVMDNALQLVKPAHDTNSYHNAQITDYDHTRQFKFRPPIRLTLTAEASSANLKGTAGFGFWNHPFSPTDSQLSLPQALWFFFSSSDSNMALAKNVQGYGWKASTFNAKQLAFYSLLPTAPLAIPLMNIPPVYDALWSIGQKAIGVNETLLDSHLLTEKHRYQIDWLPDEAIFRVDDEIVLSTTTSIPNKALGFVAWLDNQYAIVTPQGRFGFGFVKSAEEQRLILHEVRIEMGVHNYT